MAGTFDLGRVIQTAESINGMRDQAVTNRLQQAYLGQRQQQEATTFSQDQQVKNTELLNAASAEISQDPSDAAISRWLPQLESAGVIAPGVDWHSIPRDQLQAAAVKYHQSTSAALAALRGPKPVGTLLPIVGKDGKATYATPDQAVGQTPYEKPAGAPTSYDEFTLAQKDPAFANFLKSRRGKGIQITQPDGSVISIGGDGGAVAPTELTAPTKNKLQESIVQSTDQLDRLNSIGQSFDPKFLQLAGKFTAAKVRVQDLAGGLLGTPSPEEKDFLGKFSTFKSTAASNLSQVYHTLSGAAVSPTEEVRLRKGLPNDADSPIEFISKYKQSVKDTTRAIMRANWALKNGIGVKSVEDLSKALPLEGIDQVYQQRANAIWQEMGGAPETKAAAVTQANREFGIAR